MFLVLVSIEAQAGGLTSEILVLSMESSVTFPLRRSVVCVVSPSNDLPDMSGKYSARWS